MYLCIWSHILFVTDIYRFESPLLLLCFSTHCSHKNPEFLGLGDPNSWWHILRVSASGISSCALPLIRGRPRRLTVWVPRLGFCLVTGHNPGLLLAFLLSIIPWGDIFNNRAVKQSIVLEAWSRGWNLGPHSLWMWSFGFTQTCVSGILLLGARGTLRV
jgi:hypothetical protein